MHTTLESPVHVIEAQQLQAHDIAMPQWQRDLQSNFEKLENLSGKGAIVFKLGGSVTGADATDVNDPRLIEMWERLATELIVLRQAIQGSDPIVVVHGGGKAIDARLRAKGIDPNKIDGMRVTDAQTMEVVEEVLSREINTALVRIINSVAGEDIAVGIAGSSIINAQKRPSKVDIGFVGDPSGVNTSEILQHAGKIVVISPTGKDFSTGQLYNINGDDAASAVALELHKDKNSGGVQAFVAATDVSGVMSNGAVIPLLSKADVKKLLSSKVIRDGMIPKVEAALELVRSGIEYVSCCKGTEVLVLGLLPEFAGTRFL
jgi:acetylglutamate kinase